MTDLDRRSALVLGLAHRTYTSSLTTPVVAVAYGPNAGEEVAPACARCFCSTGRSRFPPTSASG